MYHFYDPPQVPSARVLPERDLPKALARALVTYGAASRTTWLLEDSGRISTDQAQLPEGSTPGHVPALGPEYWYSREASSDPSDIDSALRIPPTAKLWVGSDSTLKLYAVNAEGKATWGKAGTSIHRLKDKCWSYTIESSIVSGATLNNMVQLQLPTENVESYDFTFAVSMLNAVADEAVVAFSETSALGSELLE